jgi:hypothetical protein
MSTFKPENVDQDLGYQAGKRGKERIGGRLFDRLPPAHFGARRAAEWQIGYEAGLRERANRWAVAYWTDPTTLALTSKMYKGRPSRKRIVQHLAARGVVGDVDVYYHGPSGCAVYQCGI